MPLHERVPIRPSDAAGSGSVDRNAAARAGRPHEDFATQTTYRGSAQRSP
jgi:hypothetical protein